jgi:hypothetical protein
MREKHTHTPGPWKVCRGDWSEDGNARYELEGISVIGRADAQLIEAAPDLLAELQNIANAKPKDWDPEVRGQFMEWAQNRARAAIAKATE